MSNKKLLFIIGLLLTFIVLSQQFKVHSKRKFIEREQQDSEEKQLMDPNAAQINYPIRFVYIDRINAWWPPQKIVQGLGLPGFAKTTIYNYIALAFWSFGTGPMDIVLIWSNPLMYFGGPTQFGSTNDQIQKNLKKRYNDNGIKILISAFGATQFPTTNRVDPIACAQKLGTFVKSNNLDGVDIDWQDNSAMEAGTGQQWLISFTKRLRQLLPSPYLITHAPQGPYFKQDHYKNGAYVTVHKQVGNLIDFYNIQFYNQGDSRYDSYQELFEKATGYFSGTSVMQITKKGIPAKKLVVGKPVTPADAANTGYVPPSSLGSWTTKAYTDYGWFAGVMYWQYPSDLDGSSISTSCGHLRELCVQNKNCI